MLNFKTQIINKKNSDLFKKVWQFFSLKHLMIYIFNAISFSVYRLAISLIFLIFHFSKDRNYYILWYFIKIGYLSLFLKALNPFC
jgi:hypothetical protein